jgi:dihydrolipoamide dehydrogenase
MAESFDTIVIGGGPGGYVAAIRAAQLGQKVGVVERDKAGGRCLNYACIPAKTILRTAEIYADVKDGAELGIVGDVAIDWDALQARRAKVSESLSGGVQFLWDKNKVTLIEGEGALTPEGDVKVGDEVHTAKAVVLATGSVALPIPGAPFGGRVVDTWGAWSLPAQPRRIAVVGAGASGSELASAYSRLGTEVILIEMLPQILPAEDVDIAKVVERVFKRGGIEISTGAPVENVEVGPGSVKFTYGDKSAEVDYLCVAGGRGPDTEALGLAAAGVELEEDGRKIKVDGFGRTTNPKVFAIGDLVHRKALAHKAEEEGVVAVETAAGVETEPVDQGLIVGATFTHPQVASVGLTEEAARAAGLDVKVGKQKISGEGAGTVYDDKDGLVKLVVDSTYGEVVGAHIVGNRACDMIAELVATMALEGGYQELSRIVHPHPTVSEAVLDAARAVDGWAIHA